MYFPEAQPEPSKEDKQAHGYNRVGGAAITAYQNMEIPKIADVFSAMRNSPEPETLLAAAGTLIDAIGAVYLATINELKDFDVLRDAAIQFQKDSLPNIPKEELEDGCTDEVTDYEKVDCSKSYFLDSQKMKNHENRLFVLHMLAKSGVVVEFDKDQVFNGLKEIIAVITTIYPDDASEMARSGFYEPYVTFINKID